MDHNDAQPGTITVFLADDNVIVREGVRALLGAASPTSRSSASADDYDEPGRGRRGGRAPGARHRHPDAAELPAARASTRPRRCASAIPAPASSCCRSTTTPSTRSRCSATAPPATRTCSRTASPTATSWRGPSARSRPAASMLDPTIVEALVHAGRRRRRADRRARSSCSTRSPRAARSRRSPRAGRPRPRPRSRRGRGAVPQARRRARAPGSERRAAPAAPAAHRRSSTARSRARR